MRLSCGLCVFRAVFPELGCAFFDGINGKYGKYGKLRKLRKLRKFCERRFVEFCEFGEVVVVRVFCGKRAKGVEGGRRPIAFPVMPQNVRCRAAVAAFLVARVRLAARRPVIVVHGVCTCQLIPELPMISN